MSHKGLPCRDPGSLLVQDALPAKPDTTRRAFSNCFGVTWLDRGRPGHPILIRRFLGQVLNRCLIYRLRNLFADRFTLNSANQRDITLQPTGAQRV